MNDSLIGKNACVTARITAGKQGEVLVSVRQGTEAYFAYAAEPDAEIPVGRQVLIVDEAPGRVVYVS